MTDEPTSSPPGPGGLQFDRAETSRPSAQAPTCAACKRPLDETYYLAGSARICGSCQIGLGKALSGASGTGRILKAGLLGLLAALVGGGLWALFIYTTGSMIGFIAIGLGYLVGIAVRKGAGGRGGRAFQVLALGLVYFGVDTAYMGLALSRMGKLKAPVGVEKTAPASPEPTPGEAKEEAAPAAVRPGAAGCAEALGMLALLYVGMPLIVAKQNPFTLLFLAFALWEAWKLNARVHLRLTGPFRLGVSPGPEKSTNG